MHVPRKRFGQHFLVDSSVIDAIVRAVDARPGERVVEIGPGLGAITGPLRASGAGLTLIELDRDLAARWRAVADVELVQADVLGVDFGELARRAGQPLRVVGNLPYNISTPILFRLLDFAPHVVDQHLMLKARPGVFVAGAGLQSPQNATTVSVRDGKRQVQDGPYAESKEYLGGFVIIDVPDLDTALEWAARHPSAAQTPIEVRPLGGSSFK